MPQPNDSNSPLTIIDLTLAVKYRLQREFNGVWITGEVSGFSQANSGHCYLTLKDNRAQVNAIIWRNTAERLLFDVENGQEVLCYGSVDVYPQRGTYQFIIERIEPKGVGSLELAFRQLHAKLEREGLFDASRKKSLPKFPQRIAVVTSPTGAAIRDFLQVLNRRWRDMEILLIPSIVQGQGAGQQIARGVRICQRLDDPPDVIVVTRGGGSKEDLWCFNEEVVCRSIAESNIPVISAVGHEIDVSLSDLVADVRALTPSEAAERIAPDRQEVVQYLKQTEHRMRQSLNAWLENARNNLAHLAQRPVLTRPLESIRRQEQELDRDVENLYSAIMNRLRLEQTSCQNLASKLESLNPLSVLARGYSLTTGAGGELLNGESVKIGQEIHTQIRDAKLVSQVIQIEPRPVPEQKDEQLTG